jgi:hypothetical protein
MIRALLPVLLLVGCAAQPAAESSRAHVQPDPPSLARLHALLAAPGGMTPPAWAVDYFSGDEIPEEALSMEAKIVELSEEGGFEGYARARIAGILDEMKYDEEQDTGEIFFLFNYPDSEWVLQSSGDVRDVLLAMVADTAPEGASETTKAAVTTILEEGASYYHFRSTDTSAEMIARELILVEPDLPDAESRALEIEIGCCGGY